MKGAHREDIACPDNTFGALDALTTSGDGIEHGAWKLPHGLGNADAVATALFATTHNVRTIATKIANLW